MKQALAQACAVYSPILPRTSLLAGSMSVIAMFQQLSGDWAVQALCIRDLRVPESELPKQLAWMHAQRGRQLEDIQ
jgi:hypothetical protein